jgi:hypothetical protein
MKFVFSVAMLCGVVLYFVTKDLGFLVLAVANQISFYANEIMGKLK